jgi:cellulose synthase/poly-beta-1,6-N-acetylglucosamine synthase-like glycosyltransferase
MHLSHFISPRTSESVFAPIDETRWERPVELALSYTGISLTLVLSGLVIWEQGQIFREQVSAGAWLQVIAHSLFCLILAALIGGGLVYQITRLGYIHRRRQHQPASQDALETIFDAPAPPLLIMVPSYREEPRVIWWTMISAALQEYPNRRVVLLIDDPVAPDNPEQATGLEKARRTPYQIQAVLDVPAGKLLKELRQFEQRQSQGELDTSQESARLAGLWVYCAGWFERQARLAIHDHTDRLFVNQVLLSRQLACQERAEWLRLQGAGLEPGLIAREYRKLASVFNVRLTGFERKAFANLSHESNKAMNLNSYISLIGRDFVIHDSEAGPVLVESSPEVAELSIPSADYLIVLDADSLLLPGYALRLIHYMEQPGNERVAVAQTPYSAFRGAPGSLERLAGATTDMQYLIHQGFTRHGATFWVGANALIRRKALDDIVITTMDNGYPIKRYIQDRTVIEDTESSVDLASYGWRLYNYPERLTYSATPPDFGALIIQRRRWANGGLIIFPKLARYILHEPFRLCRLVEGVLRAHYLVSVALVNLGLVILFSMPFYSSAHSLWAPLASLPYFFLYGRDLVLSGYRKRDLFGVYALNLALVPVNLAGVIKSIQQASTGEKIPFGRTPKVSRRTASSPGLILAIYGLLLMILFGTITDCLAGRYGYAAFSFFNAMALGYALVKLVGVSESLEDLQAGKFARALSSMLSAVRDIF